MKTKKLNIEELQQIEGGYVRYCRYMRLPIIVFGITVGFTVVEECVE